MFTLRANLNQNSISNFLDVDSDHLSAYEDLVQTLDSNDGSFYMLEDEHDNNDDIWPREWFENYMRTDYCESACQVNLVHQMKSWLCLQYIS